MAGHMLVLPLLLQGLVFLLLHPLKHLFVIWKSLFLYNFADFPFNAASDHTIDGILLTLNIFLALFVASRLMDFGLEGQFFDGFLVLHLT